MLIVLQADHLSSSKCSSQANPLPPPRDAVSATNLDLSHMASPRVREILLKITQHQTTLEYKSNGGKRRSFVGALENLEYTREVHTRSLTRVYSKLPSAAYDLERIVPK